MPDVDAGLAHLLAPVEARYVLFCRDCRTITWREKDSAVVKRARDPDRTQGCTCDGEYELVRDRQPE